jgi:BioD-like phosphotransacetylase family protein
MSAVDAQRERLRNVMMDAATMVGLTLHGRDADGQAMLDSYSNPGERDELLIALVQCAASGVLTVAMLRGVSPDHALAGLIRQIRDTP